MLQKASVEAFRRAAWDALTTGRTYVEGYVVLRDGTPTEHAWTVDKRGLVFDSVLGPKVNNYWGVPIPTKVLTNFLAEKRGYGSLLYSRHVRNLVSRGGGKGRGAGRGGSAPQAFDKIAFDESVREIDQDGRLDVAVTNISKANICPYIGKEIPGAEEMGLELDKVYYLLRDPEALAAAAPSFCNVPVLSQHIPVFADDYQERAKKYVVGTTGSDCVFQAPYLRNSLKIWDGEAIKAIMSGEQKQLSCGYHYRPVMKPGTYQGEKYDGVMLDIVGNHVALVKEGRAGADVVVGDSMESVKMKKKPMTRTAAMAISLIAPYVRKRLASDQGIDLRPVLGDLTAADVRERKPAIIARLKKACKGKLAKDTTLGEVAEFLDMLEAHGGQLEPGGGGMGGGGAAPGMGGGMEGGFEDEDEAIDPGMQKEMEGQAVLEPQGEEGPNEVPGAAPIEGEESPGAGGEKELQEFLRGKLSEEDFARVMEMLGGGGGEVEGGEVEEDEGEEKGEAKLKELGADPDDRDTPEEAEREGETATDEDNDDEEPEELKEKEEHMTKDNPPGFRGAPSPGGKVAGDRKVVTQKKFVTQDEMQSAMKAAADSARKTEREIREAEKAVQPWVGSLTMTFDSAEQVYRQALKMLGVRNVANVHASALPTILDMQPKPGARKAAVHRQAEDSDIKVGSFFERFPDAGRIRLT